MTAIILKDGNTYTPEQEDILSWQQAYKNCDVYQELDAMACWCDANPSRRKTSRGVKRFVNSWLARANEKGGSPHWGKNSTRNMTTAQMFDRSWAN